MKSFEFENLKNLLREIGLLNPELSFYKNKDRKFAQITAYAQQLASVIDKMTTKRPLVLLDAGCGRAYVSFYLYAYCKEVLGRDVKIVGIDSNNTLIAQNRSIANRLGYDGMLFHASMLEDYSGLETIDIIYTLHACDKATDYAIAKGVKSQASYIFSVSCCQHTCRGQIKKHQLQSLTRYQAYKERLVDMVSDTMRGLLLEQNGYGVNIYEFISSNKTPKNIMMRASKNTAKKIDRQKAEQRYKQLNSEFNFHPVLYNLINGEIS